MGDGILSSIGSSSADNPDSQLQPTRGAGQSYTIVVRRQGQSLEFTLATIRYPINRWLIPILDSLIQLLFLLIGLSVFLLKPADRQAWLLF